MEEDRTNQETLQDQTSQEKPSSFALFLVGFIVLALGLAGFFVYKNVSQQTVSTNTPLATAITQNTNTTENSGVSEVEQLGLGLQGSVQSNKKEFEVAGKNFSFNVKEIKVKKGDMVKIIFKSESGRHDFVIDQFNVKTKVLESGQQESVTFVAEKAGTFEYYCSVGNHRQMGMVGNLIVE